MNFTKYVGVSALVAATLIFSGCGSSGASYVDDNTSVEIPVENTAPVAKAGIDQHVKTGGLVTLNSTKSYDADGDSLVYDWKIVSKPNGSTARLSSKKVSHPTFMPDVDGKYEFSLKVSDGQASSSKSYVTAVVTPVNPNPVEGTPTPPAYNAKPVANAGVDQHIKIGDKVTLDGSHSSDADHDQLTYKWSFTSKPTGSTATLSDDTSSHPTFIEDVDGTYVLSLVVNDGTVDSAPDSLKVETTHSHQNAKPVADAGVDQHVKVGDTVTLDGSFSSDADHDQLTYKWSFTSKPAGSTATLSDATSSHPSFIEDVDGTYVLSLVVNDGTVDSAPDSLKVETTHSHQNAKPIADAGTDQHIKTKSIHDAGKVYLDGSNSSDTDKDQLTYAWSIQSKPSNSTATLSSTTTSHPEFTADLDGTYVIKLIVNDGTADSASVTVTITADTNNSKPIAVSGPIQHVKTGDTVTLDASGSTDADHDPLTYKWTMTSRPNGSAATLLANNVANPTFIADVDGTYAMKLIVNDGIIDSSPVPVVVHAEKVNSKPVAVINGGADSVLISTRTSKASLNATSSTDADGDTLTYAWHIKSAPPLSNNHSLDDYTSETPIFESSRLGNYMVELTVNDGTVDSDPVSVRVTTFVTNETLRDLVAAYKSDPSRDNEANLKRAYTPEVTDMHGLFQNFTDFDLDISGWETDNVTTMNYMFSLNAKFNQDLSGWNTSSVTNMRAMFVGATAFNQNLGNWDTSNVTDMTSMFQGAATFNGDIRNWNTSHVTDMTFMFYKATSFNGDIGNWNTSKVTHMKMMFELASTFNQDIGQWNTSAVVDMISMFQDATEFDQDISNWDVANVIYYDNFSAGNTIWDDNLKPIFP